jgi:hypothetical protein
MRLIAVLQKARGRRFAPARSLPPSPQIHCPPLVPGWIR